MSNDIERLNTDCTCVTLDRDALCRAIETAVGDPEFCRALVLTHPFLLSAQPVFLTKAHAERMQQIIWAIEAIARLPQYRSAVLGNAAEIAQYRPGPIGVFMGYDFHLGEDGPMLIEINTNAGGALINAYLLQAQRACCDDMNLAGSMRTDLDALCSDFFASFDAEWKRQGRAGLLETIAIVDHAPLDRGCQRAVVTGTRSTLWCAKQPTLVVSFPFNLTPTAVPIFWRISGHIPQLQNSRQ